jgi:hypothetical protein
MSIKTIGQAIKTNLSSITGLRVFSPDEIPDTIPELPAIVLFQGKTDYEMTHDGCYNISYKGKLLAAKQDQPSALTALLDYIEPSGASSIKAAIMADRTLGGTAGDVRVISNSGQGFLDWGGIIYAATEFEIIVYGGV